MDVESDAFGDIVGGFKPEVLIMDVEGAEAELFQLADLGSIRHILVELHPHIIGEDKVAGIAGRLESDGFAVRERDRKTAYFQRAGR